VIELLALDLDGTLIGHDLTISPKVLTAIQHALDAGVRATIVTGRMFVAARPFAQRLGLHGPIVCYQGAAIFDLDSGEILRETPLSNAVAMRVYEMAKRAGLHVQMYRDDQFFVEEDNRYAELYAQLSRARPVVVESLAQTFADHDSTKVVVVTEPERANALVGELERLLGDQAYVTRSQAEFIEILNPRVNKGEALRFVAERLGISMEHTLAIGDSYNDLPLLQAAAIGVAMGSGPDELKAQADAVVADVAHDGVAAAIERFVLQGEHV